MRNIATAHELEKTGNKNKIQKLESKIDEAAGDLHDERESKKEREQTIVRLRAELKSTEKAAQKIADDKLVNKINTLKNFKIHII